MSIAKKKSHAKRLMDIISDLTELITEVFNAAAEFHEDLTRLNVLETRLTKAETSQETVRPKYTKAQLETAAYAERLYAELSSTLTRKQISIRLHKSLWQHDT